MQDNKPNRVVVTGGAGFIGSNLVRLLVAQGFEVLNIDKLSYAGNPANLDGLPKAPVHQLEIADINDSQTLAKLLTDFRPQAVMHLAAESHVDRSIDGPADFINTNINGTFQLLETCLKYYGTLDTAEQSKFRFLHVSTDEVYGSLGPTGLFTETTAYDPHSPYSASKAASDHLARAWHDTYGLPVLVTNCSNNYGPFQFPEKLIPVVILKCLQGEPIPIYGKGDNIRDWLFVDDHCRALLTVLRKGTVGETYNIGGNNELTNLDLVRTLCSVLDEVRPAADGKPYADNITFVKDRPGHDQRYAIDSSKIQDELGWAPLEDSSTGFRKTVEWYLEHESWWRTILKGEHHLQRLGTGDTA